MIRVALIRHGETAWNGERRLQGQKDIALSAAGRGQARSLAAAIAAVAPDRVVVSGLRRTAETAQELGLEPDACDSRLDEASLGEWEGRYSADIRADSPEAYAAWRAGRLTPPGGESFEQLTSRVTAGLLGAAADCAEAGGEALVIVTHGGPVRAMLAELVGLDPARAVHSHPAGFSLLDVDSRTQDVKLRLYNYSPVVLDPDPAD
ncbi:MAG: histidine phosphatase family protein [Brevibacterium yomogidense]